jgi:hypothetical protein
VIGVTGSSLRAQAERESGETRSWTRRNRGITVGSALRNHNVWLALGYVSLILLLTRTYA